MYLNLYCCIGGNRALLPSSVSVTAVDINPKICEIYKKLYPLDIVLQGDATNFLMNEDLSPFDWIWASPPCQSHSVTTRFTKIKEKDEQLFFCIDFLSKNASKKFWCVENVKPYYRFPFVETFRAGRHYFWSNFRPSSAPPSIPKMGKLFNEGNRAKLHDYLNIHFTENVYLPPSNSHEKVLRQAVHPRLGRWVFDQMIEDQRTNPPRRRSIFL